MKRTLQTALLLMALLGLTGQSGAMAMVPTSMSAGSMQASMAGMDCMDVANTPVPVPGKPPCEKMTNHCMAAMGCVSLAFVEPGSLSFDLPSAGVLKATLPLAARLAGRSYGPEPDPPSFLI